MTGTFQNFLGHLYLSHFVRELVIDQVADQSLIYYLKINKFLMK
jgi:hypothetical protein